MAIASTMSILKKKKRLTWSYTVCSTLHWETEARSAELRRALCVSHLKCTVAGVVLCVVYFMMVTISAEPYTARLSVPRTATRSHPFSREFLL